MYRIQETDDFDGLTDLFIKNGLEVSSVPPNQLKLIKCWEAADENTGERLAGIRLEKREEEFIIAGIYVENGFRKKGLGKVLVDTVAEEVLRLGGSRIMLIAKAPVFFKKAGFKKADAKELDKVISCSGCEQLNVSCFPSVMRMDLPQA